MRVLAVQALQRYGFPFFEHMVGEWAWGGVFIGRWRLFFDKVAIDDRLVLEHSNDVKRWFRIESR